MDTKHLSGVVEYDPTLVIPIEDPASLLQRPLKSLSANDKERIYALLAQEKIVVEYTMLAHTRGKTSTEKIIDLLGKKMSTDADFDRFVEEYASYLQTASILVPFTGLSLDEYQSIYTTVHGNIVASIPQYGSTINAHILLTGLEEFKKIPPAPIQVEDHFEGRKILTKFFKNEEGVSDKAIIPNHTKTLFALAHMVSDYIQWDKWEHIWIVALAGQQLDTHHRSRWTKIADYAEGALIEQSFHQHHITDEDLGETLERYKSGMRGLLD